MSSATRTTSVQWKRITNYSGPMPIPRHGHRAVLVKDLLIVFGGGNSAIFEEFHVFNTATQQWFIPAVRGYIPQGCASHGMVCDGTRVIVYGGMLEYGKYSSEMFELQSTRWEWKRLKPKPPADEDPPVARIGHSFTYHDSKVYLFGGLANETEDPKNNVLQYLNDLYVLEVRSQQYSHVWTKPKVSGKPPSPRESHTANVYTPKGDGGENNSVLVIFGGMDGTRLGDLHMLKLGDELSWFQPELHGVGPQGRSLHVAEVLGKHLYIFGGWTSLVADESKQDDQWKVSKELTSLNLETNTWVDPTLGTPEEMCPPARAGHCSTAVHSRMYIWSGRDGYRKVNDNQVCLGDIWYLETEKPAPPSRIQLIQATTNSLEICWGSIPIAEAYLLQIQRYILPLPPLENTNTTLSGAAYARGTTTKHSSGSVALPKVVQIMSQAGISADKLNTPAVKTSAGTASDIVSNSENMPSDPMAKTIRGISASGTSTTSTLGKSGSVPSTGSYRIVQQQAGPTQVLATTNGSTKLLTFIRRDSGRGAISLTPISKPKQPANLPSGTSLVRITQGSSNITNQASAKMEPPTPSPRPVAGEKYPAQIKVYPHLGHNAKQTIVITRAQAAPLAQTTLAVSMAQKPSDTGGDTGGHTEALNVPSSTELAIDLNEQPPANLMAGDDLPSHEKLSIPETVDALMEEDESQTRTEDRAPAARAGTVNECNPTPDDQKTDRKPEKHSWMDVAVVKSTIAMIMHYHFPPDESKEYKHILALEPGQAYKLRVAGINVCGRGKWSEISAFKTCLPGFPCPPIGVKIYRHGEGAHVSWFVPIHTNGSITEYSLYLAVKSGITINYDTVTETNVEMSSPQLAFVRVYYGLTTMCLVQHQTLTTAYIDNSVIGKPSIIFRLAAKNENGYGAAAQVRWLLDPKIVELLAPVTEPKNIDGAKVAWEGSLGVG